MKEICTKMPLVVHAALLDDDPDFTRSLKEQLRSWSKEAGCTVILSTFATGLDLLYACEAHGSFDVVFLDIALGTKVRGGMDVAHSLREQGYSGRIVFITSSTQWSLEGYDVEASAYLTKPLDPERLCECLHRLARDLRREGHVMLFTTADGELRVRCGDIISLRAFRNYVTVTTTGGSFRSRTSLTAVIDRLPPGFVHCNRSEVVNLAWVDAIAGRNLQLHNGEAIPVSRSRLKDVRQDVHHFFSRMAGDN